MRNVWTTKRGEPSGKQFEFNAMFYIKVLLTPSAPTPHLTDSKVDELLNDQRSNVRAFKRTISNLGIEKVTEKWQLQDKL